MTNPTFYKYVDGDYVETTLRPSPDDPVFSTRKDGYKHKLGDGWHHIDDVSIVLWDGKWKMLHEDSTVPILYSVYKLFESLNCAAEFQQLCADSGLDDFTPENMEYGKKHFVEKEITIDDLSKILEDLEDINYHNFANKLESILAKV